MVRELGRWVLNLSEEERYRLIGLKKCGEVQNKDIVLGLSKN